MDSIVKRSLKKSLTIVTLWHVCCTYVCPAVGKKAQVIKEAMSFGNGIGAVATYLQPVSSIKICGFKFL